MAEESPRSEGDDMVLEHETAAQDTNKRFERAASDAGMRVFVAARQPGASRPRQPRPPPRPRARRR